MDEAVEADELAGLPLLHDASPAQLRALAASLGAGEAATGEVLGREGEGGEVFWLLLGGRVEVTARTRDGPRHLADAGPGSVLGELALLRGQPRTATVTAAEACRFAWGRADALERLLDIAPARDRIQRLASYRLAEALHPIPIELPDGFTVLIRPLLPEDRPAVDQAVQSLSRETLRHRFFTAGGPSPALVDYLMDLDYVDHFAWAGIDARTRGGVATGRYVRRPGEADAEVAFTILDAYQGRGLGTMMLGAVGLAASEAGITSLVAHVMEDNRAMRSVFAKAGGQAELDDPGLLIVRIDPSRAAQLLDGRTRHRVASAVHDVVTAASVALRT